MYSVHTFSKMPPSQTVDYKSYDRARQVTQPTTSPLQSCRPNVTDFDTLVPATEAVVTDARYLHISQEIDFLHPSRQPL